MKKRLWILIGGALAALLIVGAIGAGSAFAQSSSPNAPLHGRGPGGGRGPGEAGLAAAAEMLGMTTDELSSALRSGKTLPELAEEAGVDLQEVQDAISAVRGEELRARIEQALADGTMSQEKADWLLEGLEKGFLDGPGFGSGFGPHGPRPDKAPSVEPTQSTSG